MDNLGADCLEIEPEIAWDGAVLTVWGRNARGRFQCAIPRATIHALPQFSDALDREILRDRVDIVERLRSTLLRKAAVTDNIVIRLSPDDLQRSAPARTPPSETPPSQRIPDGP